MKSVDNLISTMHSSMGYLYKTIRGYIQIHDELTGYKKKEYPDNDILKKNELEYLKNIFNKYFNHTQKLVNKNNIVKEIQIIIDNKDYSVYNDHRLKYFMLCEVSLIVTIIDMINLLSSYLSVHDYDSLRNNKFNTDFVTLTKVFEHHLEQITGLVTNKYIFSQDMYNKYFNTSDFNMIPKDILDDMLKDVSDDLKNNYFTFIKELIK